MKKIHLVSLLVLALLLSYYSDSYSQTVASVQKKIEFANKQFLKWFNAGKADSIITQYHANACITGKGCGTTFLKAHYKGEVGTYTVKELTTLDVTLDGNKAIENGQWRIMLPNSVELSGKYQTEWQQVNNRWVILKETIVE